MIEAMAAGTPVIAWRAGSTPEVIEHGRSGLLVQSLDEAVAAVDIARRMPRARVRASFEERFTAERMARDYVSLYRRLVGSQREPAARQLQDALTEGD
jgi:glycosyltransferase involved in cell wall biosynthesis